MSKHNKPLQIRQPGQPAPSAALVPPTHNPTVSSAEITPDLDDPDTLEHDEGAAETDQEDRINDELNDLNQLSDEEQEEAREERRRREPHLQVDGVKERERLHAQLVDEAPSRMAPRASVLTPRREKGGSVEVTPLRTVNRMRIGQPWYSFTAGVTCSVPRDIVPLLQERGIVPFGIRL